MSTAKDGGGPKPPRWWAGLWLLVPFLPVAVFLLVAEHRVHAFGLIPYALVVFVAVALLLGVTMGRRGNGGPK